MSVDVIPLSDAEDTDFTVTFNSTHSILTTVTSSSSAVSAWITTTLAASASTSATTPSIVGLDCEWRPNLSPSTNHPVATLQLSLSDRCLIYQLLHADAPFPPPALTSFLSDPRFRFVGVGIAEDAEKILEDHEIPVRNAVDLRVLAEEKTGRKDTKQMGLAGLAKELIGVDVKKPKRVRMGRWDQEVLMLDQIGYACVDAFLSFEIGRRLFGDENTCVLCRLGWGDTCYWIGDACFILQTRGRLRTLAFFSSRFSSFFVSPSSLSPSSKKIRVRVLKWWLFKLGRLLIKHHLLQISPVPPPQQALRPLHHGLLFLDEFASIHC